MAALKSTNISKLFKKNLQQITGQVQNYLLLSFGLQGQIWDAKEISATVLVTDYYVKRQSIRAIYFLIVAIDPARYFNSCGCRPLNIQT
jgi:hypothetical protein